MARIKSLVKDTAVYGVSSIIGKLLNWLLVPFYTRVLAETADYGVVSHIYGFTALAVVLLTYGLETGYFRFASQHEDKDVVFSTGLFSLVFTSLIFIVGLTMGADGLADVLGYAGHSEYLIWMGWVVALDAFISLPLARLRFEKRPFRFMGVTMVSILVNIGLNLFFFLMCPWIVKNTSWEWIDIVYKPEIGVGYVFISNLISSAVKGLLLLPQIVDVHLRFDFKLWLKMLKYSLPLLLVGVAGVINQSLDKMVLPMLIPADQNPKGELGIYSANYRIAVIMAMFTQAFRYAFEPFFFSQKHEESTNKMYADVLKYFVILGLIIFLGVVLFLDIVKYFVDTPYYGGLKVVPIVLLAQLFMGMFYNLSLWYKLTDKTFWGARLAMAGGIVTIVGNFYFVPMFGYMASAWSAFVCYLFMFLASYFIGRRVFPVPYDFKRIVGYFLLALGLWGITFFLEPDQLVLKLIYHAILVLFFVGVVLRKEPVLNRMLTEIVRKVSSR